MTLAFLLFSILIWTMIFCWLSLKIGEEKGATRERDRVRNLIGLSMERKATGELVQLERAVRNGLVELD